MLCLALTAEAQTWLSKLRNEDIIDSVVVAKEDKGWAGYLKMYSYHIYYHQPLAHSEPDGEQFQLRATLVVRQGASTTLRPMQCFISGYHIHEYNWDNPSYYVGEGSKDSDFLKLQNILVLMSFRLNIVISASRVLRDAMSAWSIVLTRRMLTRVRLSMRNGASLAVRRVSQKLT